MEPELAEHFERRLRYTETRSGTPDGFPDFPIIKQRGARCTGRQMIPQDRKERRR